jgi:pterin-4a-carbinolamine dehydratase
MNPVKTNYDANQLHQPQKQITSMKKLQTMKRFLLSTALLATLANTAQAWGHHHAPRQR